MASSAAAASIPAAAAARVGRKAHQEGDTAPSSSPATVITHPQELLLSAPGPYGCARLTGSVTDGNLRLETRLTVPIPVGADPPSSSFSSFTPGTGRNTTAATARPTTTSSDKSAARWPVVLHFSGFQCTSDQYSPLAERLATHGYAVVQYSLPRYWPGVSRIVPDEQELAALGVVWGWAAKAQGGDGSLLLDEGRVAVAGHSRGGKLAALTYARQYLLRGAPVQASAAAAAAASSLRRRQCPLGFGGGGAGSSVEGAAAAAVAPPPSLPPLRALFLADPVDNTPALARRGYPSGVDALRSAIKAAANGAVAEASPPTTPPTFALACAGRFGGGNPMGANWLEFLAVAPPRARSLLLHNAGHATFIQEPPDGSAGARAIDWAFGGGSAPREQTMALVAGFLLSWLRRQGLAGARGGPSPEEEEEADAEEARWLAAVQGAAAAATPTPLPMVRVSAEVKLGAAPCAEDESETVSAQIVRPAVAIK